MFILEFSIIAFDLSYHFCLLLFSEKVIYAAADGCEIQRAAGQQLCSLFPFDDSVDLKALKMGIRDNPRKLPSLLETEISYLEFRNAKRYFFTNIMFPFDAFVLLLFFL